jgi:hypothetical protein
MGLFFTIVTLGLASRLPGHLYKGLVAAGISPSAAHVVANEPPIGSLFSAFLGYNPIKELLGPTGALQHLPAAKVNYITGRSFFPSLIEQPFAGGLHLAFTFAAIATAVAIIASALRGRRYIHTAADVEAEAPVDPVIGEMVTLPADDELADGLVAGAQVSAAQVSGSKAPGAKAPGGKVTGGPGRGAEALGESR